MKIIKKGKYIKVILVCMFTYLILFTCACLFITYKTGEEPSTLIMCVFAFCGVEGGMSAWIKITKEKKKSTSETKEE
jgi:ABC-type transport system involved in multi-copper enzyme maturation permease subunit